MTQHFYVSGLAFLISSVAVASVDYTALNGKYSYVSGSGSTASCEAGLVVEANAAQNQVVLKNGAAFVDGFFNINQGPKNDCCQGSDAFDHNDDDTTGDGTSLHEVVSEYYQVIRKDYVSVYTHDLSLEGDTLTYSISNEDYQNPEKSTETVCTFKKL